MPITTSEEKFVHELADMYDAEHQFLEAMGQMREMATDDKLRHMLEEHMQQTEEQIAKLEEVFSEIGKDPERQECMGAKGLVEEASKMMQEAGSSEIRDAVIAGAATKAEHYEIASYGCLRTWARLMDHQQACSLLQQTLDEEEAADEKLNELADRLNRVAAEAVA